MTFFPEINEKQTIRNAKRKLKEYPRWRRIAGDIDGQKVTATYSFEPRQSHGSPSRPVERLVISKVDALAELEAIEYAVGHLLDPYQRKILYDLYLTNYPKSNAELENELGYEKTRYHEIVSNALLAFAELYRSGCLVALSGIIAE
ncbi:ArpU family phage packaging/lysis transcriptional regulator [Streptococcus respiraculi]|uniref:ArpU family phage packaging/lysis transcriptional regulator n=1 Tax=Streptococcus respiraculi TaxID=2021971 RepID=UPI000E771AAE|nr:ArpU family phage packaging/lysis transcriptional regulator [Streptococcus respiraculi]